MKVDELELEYERHKNDPVVAEAILSELKHRKTKKAKALERKIKCNGEIVVRKKTGKKVAHKKIERRITEERAKRRVTRGDEMEKGFRADNIQESVIKADSNCRLLIDAGPGTGKTAVACARVAYLVKGGLDPTGILLFSFTQAAVKEIKNRIRELSGPEISVAGLKICTLDQLSFEILGGLPGTRRAELLRRNYDGNIDTFIERLKEPGPELLEMFCELKHVVIDEAQDLVGRRATAVLGVISHLSEGCGITVFADSAQAIYGFTNEDEAPEGESLTLEEKITEGEYQFQCRQLENIYRTEDSHLCELYHSGRARLTGKRESNAAGWRQMRDLIKQYAHEEVGREITEHGLADRHDVLVLFRSRAEVLTCSSYLLGDNIAHKLRMSGLPPRIYPWVARVLGGCKNPGMSENEFKELWDEKADDSGSEGSVDRAWKLLYRFAGETRTKKISLKHLRSVLGRDRPPVDFLVDETDLPGPVIGTIHSSKGRESEEVQLMMKSSCYTGDRDNKDEARRFAEEERVLFVGASRARRKLVTGPGSFLKNSRRLKNSNRAYRITKKSMFNIQLGIHGDVDAGSVVSEDFFTLDEARVNQDFLWNSRFEKKDLHAIYSPDRRRSLLHEKDRPLQHIACLSGNFSNDLRETVNKWKKENGFSRDYYQPPGTINYIYMVGTGTAVVPEGQRDTLPEPWRVSGFVLVPFLAGFPPVFPQRSYQHWAA